MDDLIRALRGSHDRLRGLVAPLDDATLGKRSYAAEWSIAQVLSHLGSGAEITGLLLDAGLAGDGAPPPEAAQAIWDVWNAKTPRAQADDALTADAALSGRIESLSAEERERIHLTAFGMELDFPAIMRVRLSEHALHSWDIAVALDPAATVAPDAVELVVDSLAMVVARSARPSERLSQVEIMTTDPSRRFALTFGDAVTLAEATGPEDGLPGVRLPAEAFVRLVYGRLDPANTPVVETRDVDLDELRQVFPGP